ncbi:VanZ family protein [Subsaximicrobium wynnwilliamsii]|jgi:VanZ family protein|uniref:VanZ family protein n=1 Tax=Subsaximicrobium wynnwilliamsii TaxID=291179 RepID=A0A5C6ZFW9_9FLAO|nr:VanZ family protein [Subsaximicrobium wynnwilliamsii]TXD82445.1 VanZ family protein [Subsaximicrobium wynnwilliamsii]TXD88087.1 VanZ family protein [Subsaximicrobium wynnwilliamsii]TXE02051.1 VanZ family protein [Subsaximicrobium wynnwilliamsii]
MLTKILLALKKWALPLLVLYAFALTAGSLVNTGGMPDLGSSFDDKIYHAVAYSIFTILIYNVLKLKNFESRIFIAVVAVLVYGIIIEVLQYLLTTYRTLDGYDILANSIGAILGMLLLWMRKEVKLKKNA